MIRDIFELKRYLKDQYDLDFQLDTLGTHKYLILNQNKKEYNLSFGYAQQPKIGEGEYWSLYHDFMDKKEWHGYGGAEVFEGANTVDEIMQEWGFTKQQEQLTLF